MIKKLYDFRNVTVPAALLQAEVTGEELAGELALAAARFTRIVATAGPVEKGDVVTLEYADEKGAHRVYANVGKDFSDVETLLPGLNAGDRVQMRYAGKTVDACVAAIKRPTVPALTDGHVAQLGIDNVATVAELEEHLFQKLAHGQRRRKFRGIMGIVAKAVMENTEFSHLLEHPWYLALHELMMGRVAAYAAREGMSVDEALPAALRMEGKSREECLLALQDMCLERARQGALGRACAGENGVEFADEGDTAELIGRYADYFEEVVFAHFAPRIKVDRR